MKHTGAAPSMKTYTHELCGHGIQWNSAEGQRVNPNIGVARSHPFSRKEFKVGKKPAHYYVSLYEHIDEGMFIRRISLNI